MDPENYVFRGKFFLLTKELEGCKNFIVNFLNDEGFVKISRTMNLYEFFSMTFNRIPPKLTPSIGLRIKKTLGFINQEEFNIEKRFVELSRMRDELPFEVDVSFHIGKYKDMEGTFFELLSKPAIYFKIAQLHFTKNISKEKYSFIKIENTSFITKFAKALHGIVIEEPMALKQYVTSEVIDKLNSYGFENVSKIIKDGKTKIELGDSSGLDDLRGAIDNFAHDIILKLDKKPFNLDDPERNIALLKSLGYLNNDIERMLLAILHKGVYVFLSNTKTHSRKDIDIFTSRLCFNVTETIFDDLIERVIHYKTKVVEQDSLEKQ